MLHFRLVAAPGQWPRPRRLTSGGPKTLMQALKRRAAPCSGRSLAAPADAAVLVHHPTDQVRCAAVLKLEAAVGEQSVPGRKTPQWGWWLGVLVFATTFAIDLIDGPWLKLVTSALFLVACLLAASFRWPRPPGVTLGIGACGVGAVLLVLYRLVGPGIARLQRAGLQPSLMGPWRCACPCPGWISSSGGPFSFTCPGWR